MTWIIHTDGGSRGNPGPAALGFTIERDGTECYAYGEFLQTVTNNVAEYTAVLRALQTFAELAPAGTPVEIKADSKLVVEQLSGRWKIKHADMRSLALQVKKAYDPTLVTYTWVAREENKRADEMANKAMDARGTVGGATDQEEPADEPPPAGPCRFVVVAAPITDRTLAILDRLAVGRDERFLPVRVNHLADAPSQSSGVRIARHVRAAGAEVTTAEVAELSLDAAEGGTTILVGPDAAHVLSRLAASSVTFAPAAGSVSVIDHDAGAFSVRAIGVFA